MKSGNTYIPRRGDIVWLTFNPQLGHEQAGRRPALVISPRSYNQKAGLAIFCPITTQIKNYPFEVQIAKKQVSGVILSDQLKSLDWKSRKAAFICKINQQELNEVVDKINVLINEE
jgi:mRNA interferase MazF